ncbi:MAG: adenylate kinase, partial [Candidatus Altiarchaeota archaeon]|nr:adenylate kinase [Candidatus Altiarchaeota archaeon]
QGYELVNYGTIMFELAKRDGLVETRDEMRTKIPTQEYQRLQKKAGEKIGSMNGKFVIDTHASVLKPEGYYPGLPEQVIKAINPNAIIVVEADPAEVEARRSKDAGIRKREGDVAEHQAINRQMAAVYSVLTAAPLSFVVNEQGKLDDSIKNTLKILKSLGD